MRYALFWLRLTLLLKEQLKAMLAFFTSLLDCSYKRRISAPGPLKHNLLFYFEEVEEQTLWHFIFRFKQMFEHEPEIKGREPTHLQQLLELHIEYVMDEEDGLSGTDSDGLDKGVLDQ